MGNFLIRMRFPDRKSFSRIYVNHFQTMTESLRFDYDVVIFGEEFAPGKNDAEITF